jgi:hypothetical protein
LRWPRQFAAFNSGRSTIWTTLLLSARFEPIKEGNAFSSERSDSLSRRHYALAEGRPN